MSMRQFCPAIWLIAVAAASAQTQPPAIVTTSYVGAVAGSADFTLVVDGSGFAPGAIVRFDSTRLATTFLNSSRVTCVVSAALVAKAGNAQLWVVNPDGSVSAPFVFMFGAPFPGITSLSPNTAPAGAAFSLAINGEGFLPGALVDWNNTSFLTPIAITPTQILVAIPKSLAGVPGTVNVWVANDVSNATATSNWATMRIGVPVPAGTPIITSYSPASTHYLGSDFTLTVNGTNFDRNAVVGWSTGAVQTTFVSSSQLIATVPSSAQGPCCALDFWVINPAANSDNARFPILPAPAALLALTPPLASALNGPFKLTARGFGFSPGAAILWNATPLNTTFVSSSELSATVPANLLATAATPHVSVSSAGYTTGWLPFSLTGPTIYPGGMVNAASALQSVAPGSLISIYGSELAPGTFQNAALPLPAALGGVSVTINGTPAPLLFVSPSQINAQVPYEAIPGPASIIVRANGAFSPPAQCTISPTSPGIYMLPSTDHAVAIDLPSGTLNSSNTPARPGEYVIVYVTGQGAVDPGAVTGNAAPADPLSRPLAITQATIDGVPATVPFAGLAPGFVGLLQVNLQIPAVAPGERLLTITVGGVKSNVARISVGAP